MTGAAMAAVMLTTGVGGSGAAGVGGQTAAGRPSVVVIGTGGTIAGTAPSRVDFQTYQPASRPARELVDELRPEIEGVARVRAVDFGAKGSGEYTIADFRQLSLMVDEHLRSADAVVVTTGTQTMEELAYWLDLTVRSQKPVVVTAAMRPWNVVGSDGPSNLYNSVVLAASRRTVCFGTVLMLNDEIFAAREATKTSTTRLDTLQAPEVGVLGVVDERRVRLQRAPARVQHCAEPDQWRTPFDLSGLGADALPRVEIMYAYADAGGEPVDAFVHTGVKGLIAAGTPTPAQMAPLIAALQSGVQVVAANRNGSGGVYETPEGVIAAEDLPPQKARLLLLLALARAENPEQIRRWFQRYGIAEFAPDTRG
ncbi:asparaginase [Catellatospora sichuanensis]|uniref:asparaginase n=1 Tax=Catellatospora sichuanensis TaxID=1969805 RepID=UPI001642B557|nr:asparaginase [Catellatospora sichuanensis]